MTAFEPVAVLDRAAIERRPLAWRRYANSIRAINPTVTPTINQIVRNFAEFHAAFGVTEKDKMWLAPADRVKIW